MESLLTIAMVVATTAVLARALDRSWVAPVLLGWAALTSALALLGAYDDFNSVPPRFVFAIFLPLAAGIAATRALPAVRAAVDAAPIRVLLGVQVYRLAIGIWFLVLLKQGVLPARFAHTAGWGDILVGAIALALAVSYVKGAAWRGAALAWNVLGFCDLAAVVCIAQLSTPTPMRFFFDEVSTAGLAAFPLALVPTWIVPLTFTLHFVIFRRLLAELAQSSPAVSPVPTT